MTQNIFSIYKKTFPTFDNLTVLEDKIKIFSQNLDESQLKIPTWEDEVFFIEGSKRDIEFIFLINTINFCFWSLDKKEKWQYRYKNKKYSGSMSLFSALKNALENNYPLLDFNYLESINETELAKILNQDKQIPLLKERCLVLNEIGKLSKNNNLKNFYSIYEKSNESAIDLIKIIIDLYPSFRDFSFYKNNKYPILKRAQLIPAMIFGRYQNQNPFNDINNLIVFSDYKIPQTLRNFGLIEYSQSLAEKIQNQEIITNQSLEEIEIRLSSIFICEFIKSYNKNLNSLNLDYFLWLNSKNIKIEYEYHKTFSIFY
ncbi:MAG: queuosine salvage family protein [Candidatus Sericytochromatia bacterium]